MNCHLGLSCASFSLSPRYSHKDNILDESKIHQPTQHNLARQFRPGNLPERLLDCLVESKAELALA